MEWLNGAPRRNRTGTPIQEQDFESCASTNSARGAQIFKFELECWGNIVLQRVRSTKKMANFYFLVNPE